MAVWKGKWSIGWLKSCTERVCIMNVRLVCAFASSSCIGTEPAAYVEENVESENTDFRAVAQGTLPCYLKRRCSGLLAGFSSARGAYHMPNPRRPLGTVYSTAVPARPSGVV